MNISNLDPDNNVNPLLEYKSGSARITLIVSRPTLGRRVEGRKGWVRLEY